MLLDGEFPPDERVEKEAVSLIHHGNEVSLLCLNYGKQVPTELYNGIYVIRIKINKNIRNKLLATYLILPFYKFFWKSKVERLLKLNQIDVLHIHDLPLSDIGIRLRKKHYIKVVCDQHEYYSKWIVNTAHYNTPVGKMVKLFSNWDSYEKKYLPSADLVVTVEQPLKDFYVSECRIKNERIVVLPNTPSIKLFNYNSIDQKIIDKFNDYFVIFYAGSIDILRGIDTIIGSLPLLRKKIPNLKFVFAGRFNPKYYDPIRIINNMGVSELTEYLGWIPLSSLPAYIAASDICVHVPPISSDEVNNSIATKIYQYLLMHKPVIVGQAKLMREFVEKNKFGLSIRESDSNDLADKIYHLYSSPGLIQEFTRNAKKVAFEYTWEQTSKSFIDSYEKLML